RHRPEPMATDHGAGRHALARRGRHRRHDRLGSTGAGLVRDAAASGGRCAVIGGGHWGTKQGRGNETGTQLVSRLGRPPSGQTVWPKLSSLAVRFTHSSSPNGRPLSTLTRSRASSFALSGAFTRSVRSTGRSTGQGERMALITSSPCILAHRPLQRQRPAGATNPAPTAFRSLYRKTVN